MKSSINNDHENDYFCDYLFKNIKEYPIFTDDFYTENIISISIDYDHINFNIILTTNNSKIHNIIDNLKKKYDFSIFNDMNIKDELSAKEQINIISYSKSIDNTTDSLNSEIKNTPKYIHQGGGNEFFLDMNKEDNTFIIDGRNKSIRYEENNSEKFFKIIEKQIKQILNIIYKNDKNINFGISLNKCGTLFTGYGNIKEFI
jgi:hypothetical protein